MPFTFLHTAHSYVPDISEQESSMHWVFNSTEWQQHRVRYLQGTTGNGGMEAYLEAAIFRFKLNAVFILTLTEDMK